MLHKDPFIISPATYTLIQELQALPEFDTFFLVGGTALAMQLGHRNSIDIDLFTRKEFEDAEVLNILHSRYQVTARFSRNNTIICFINDIKTDFIRHDYPFVNPPITEEGITFLSKEDIAAMKLLAISNSGQRIKDFMDIYFLLEHYSISDMLGFFAVKYPNYNAIIPLRAISYFEDIDPAIDPPKMVNPVSLKELKARITDAVLHSKKRY